MGKLIRQAAHAWLAGALILGLAAQPALAAPAMHPALQEDAFDPLLRETVARGVAATADVAVATGSPLVPEAEADAPKIDLSTQVQYSYGGVTLRAPLDWDVVEDSFDSLFEITMPGTEFYAALQEIEDEFPSLILVTFLTNLPESFLTEFSEDAVLTSVEAGVTAQQLPLAAIHFDATIEGMKGSGVLYVISPGETAYMLIAFAPSDVWAALAPGVAMMAESMVFDEELLTLVTAEGGSLAYVYDVRDDGVIKTTIPEGWHVTRTHDELLPLFVSEPAYTFGVAIGGDAAVDSELGALVDELLRQMDTDLAPETLGMVFDELAAVIDEAGFLIVDEALNAYYPREGALTLRIAGKGDLGDGLTMPVMIYFDLRADGLVIQVVIGDVESALEMEADLLELMVSTVIAE